MIIASLIVIIVYSAFVYSFIYGFEKVGLEKNNEFNPQIKFSIIIPFRNEEAHLNSLLTSLLNIDYPRSSFEVLLVNDASDDNSTDIIVTFQMKHPELNISILNNIRKTNSPKKDAINTAIAFSNFDWIVTTDADCTVSKNWLLSFNSFIKSKEPVFISAPVKFNEERSFLFHFQHLNSLSLIGSTIGSFGINKPFLCNGANLCYKKEVFLQLNGFKGNTEIASGDDIFLLEKMNTAFPEKTLFLKSKNAIVTTTTENSWNSYYNQQLRWASKSSSYKNWFAKIIGILVLLTNSVLVIIGLLTINPKNWFLFTAFFSTKMLFDLILIKKTANFLNSKINYAYFVITSFLYPLFIMVVGISSFTKKYNWKGRTFKK